MFASVVKVADVLDEANPPPTSSLALMLLLLLLISFTALTTIYIHVPCICTSINKIKHREHAIIEVFAHIC